MATREDVAAAYDDPLQEVDAVCLNFVSDLANVLTHLVALAGKPDKVTRFHSTRPSELSIHDYLTRIATYFRCSNECFVLCLVYIDRVVKLHPEFVISKFNVHRLVVTSVLIAVKFFDDVYYSNAYYAKVGGVKNKEMNTLEAHFLVLLDWNLHVSPREYDEYRSHVYRAVCGDSQRTLGPSCAVEGNYRGSDSKGCPGSGDITCRCERKSSTCNSIVAALDRDTQIFHSTSWGIENRAQSLPPVLHCFHMLVKPLQDIARALGREGTLPGQQKVMLE